MQTFLGKIGLEASGSKQRKVSGKQNDHPAAIERNANSNYTTTLMTNVVLLEITVLFIYHAAS